MDKKFISVIIIIFVLILVVYQFFFRNNEPDFELAEVSWGRVYQEVTETGQVKKGGEIGLIFQTAGQIENIYVEVGQIVEAGEKLVRLDAYSLLIQLQEAKAAQDLAQAKLDKVLAGATPEEIKIAETKVENYQISLTTAQENLDQAFGDAQNSLNDAYLKIYNVFNAVDSIKRSYFTSNDQESLKVKDERDKIGEAMSQAKNYLDVSRTSPTNENINKAISEMKVALETTSEALRSVRESCETSLYRSTVSAADKTSLDTHRGYINTALTNITNSQQTISSEELDVVAAEGNLQTAKDELALLIAEPRPEDVDLYAAQVKQAQAQVALLQNSLQEATLTSPIKGQITQIHKEIGEQAQPLLQDLVITLLPATPFEIEVDIYEEDVVKIKIGNQVDISLVAFPEQTFEGQIISIDPAEKLLEGVVYYEVNIGPVPNSERWIPETAKPGMTADLTIKTVEKDNVLIVLEDAIEKKNGKTIVQVFKDDATEEREIEIGLWGNNDLVEVISGLREGEKVIIR